MGNKADPKDIQFKIGSRVFYPSHGAGTVIAEKNIEFGGEEKKYLEFEFINKKLSISAPLYNISNLGIREVTPAKELKEKIKNLKSKPAIKPKVKDYSQLIEMINELSDTGSVDSFIEVIQYCNNEKDIREKEGRLVPVSISKYIYNMIDNLTGELALAINADYNDAAKEFEKLTGLTVKL